jgi:hypothetical protein
MSTELKGVTGRTGKVSMLSFFGGKEDGRCVQMTFRKPDEEKCSSRYWYLQLTKEEALEMAVALVQFANGTREEVFD